MDPQARNAPDSLQAFAEARIFGSRIRASAPIQSGLLMELVSPWNRLIWMEPSGQRYLTSSWLLLHSTQANPESSALKQSGMTRYLVAMKNTEIT